MRLTTPPPAKSSRAHARIVATGLIVILALALLAPRAAGAATAPTLGTAQNFAVLGGSTVTNTGSSTVNGDLGVSPGTVVSGFPPGLVTGGTIHRADAIALQAQQDVTTAYNALTGQACDTILTGQNLGGLTLTPGVYCYADVAQLTGTLTLDAQTNTNAVFVFKIGSTLTTASNARVQVINGGSPCNTYWQVGSSATLGTNTTFVGNILALTSISLTTGTGITGRALARNGAVTLDTNTVSFAACAAAAPTATPTATATATATPPPTATPVPPTMTPSPTATGVPVLPTPTATTATPTLTASPRPDTPRIDNPTPTAMIPTKTPTPQPASVDRGEGPAATATPQAATPSTTTLITPTVSGTMPGTTPTASVTVTTATPTGTTTPGTATTTLPTPTPTAPIIPRLPNSGGGGGQQPQPTVPTLPLILLAAALTIGGLLLRRRGARRH